MIAIDTNVLIRLFVGDDDGQVAVVTKMLGRRTHESIFVSDLVILETSWTLSARYGWSAGEIADAFTDLMALSRVALENEARLVACLSAYRRGADLADELIVRSARDKGSTHFATFDKGIIKRHKPFAARPA